MAQGGLDDETDPLISSAVNIKNDDTETFIYTNMNNAINLIDVEEMDIPQRMRINDNQIELNPFKQTNENNIQNK